jgi:hypothetical protein
MRALHLVFFFSFVIPICTSRSYTRPAFSKCIIERRKISLVSFLKPIVVLDEK